MHGIMKQKICHDRPISACFTELRNFPWRLVSGYQVWGTTLPLLILKDSSYWSVIQWYNTHIMKQIPIENSCNRSICAGKGQPCSSSWDIALGITHEEDLFGIWYFCFFVTQFNPSQHIYSLHWALFLSCCQLIVEWKTFTVCSVARHIVYETNVLFVRHICHMLKMKCRCSSTSI